MVFTTVYSKKIYWLLKIYGWMNFMEFMNGSIMDGFEYMDVCNDIFIVF